MMATLHRHDHFSLWDGAGKAPEAAEYAAKIGQKALALTNHGNVSGLIQHFNACNDVGIKPILGVEAYFVVNAKKKTKSYTHLTILAKNDEGYSNLMRLVSAANSADAFYYRPRIDMRMLRKYGKGLIVLSGCSSSLLSKLLIEGDRKMALKLASTLNEAAEHFFIEVMPHRLGQQSLVNEGALWVGAKLGIPAVMTLDSHYTKPGDADTHYIKRLVSNPNAQKSDYEGLCILGEQEMIDMWRKNYENLGSAKRLLAMSDEIADMCDTRLDFGVLMPHIDWGMPSDVLIKKLASEGLRARGFAAKREYRERLKYETQTVLGLGFEDVFLICQDVVSWSHKNGISTGFGRGSVGGSLLAHVLGITEVDPIVHGTMFERFLRPDKKKMPDIDIDFDSRYRDKVFKYISDRYSGQQAPVIAYGKYKVRNLMNDLAKVLQVDNENRDWMTARIFEVLETGGIEDVRKDHLLAHKDRKGVIKHFAKLYNQIRYFGRHASGVAICPGNITDFVATVKKGDEFVTSYDLNDLESLNILKMDVLGLDTVSAISIAEKEAGVKFDPKFLEDEDVYNMLGRGESDGVFQFEGGSVKRLLRQVRPANLAELTACTALNRPAPIKLGVLDAFIEGKSGDVDDSVPWYKWTKETYGAIVYQEQVMAICRGLAGMSWQDTDGVMKSLKPKVKKDDPLLKAFVKGAAEHSGVSKKEAVELFGQMTKYLFNMAHGVAYTMMSAYAAYLMLHYPLEFIYALLTLEGKPIKRRNYEAMAAERGIVVMLAHVNHSKAHCTIREVDGEKVIQQGLAIVKGVGFGTAEEIAKRGPYSSEDDMKSKIEKRILRSNVIAALKEYGALEFDEKKWLSRVVSYNAALIDERRR